MKAGSLFETARGFASRSSPFIGLVVVFAIGALISPFFLTLENLANFARTSSIMGFVAIGMTFVILCGSIDLSVSSVFSLSGFLFILLSKYSIALAICVPLAAGLVVGLFNGVLITWLSIPAFVATLATMIFLRGLVLVVTNETTFRFAGLSSVLSFLGRGMIFKYISFPLLMFIAAIVVASFVLRRRPIGRAMYIVGGNAEAARMMGVSVMGTMTTAHVICSVMAALGGIFRVPGRCGLPPFRNRVRAVCNCGRCDGRGEADRRRRKCLRDSGRHSHHRSVLKHFQSSAFPGSGVGARRGGVRLARGSFLAVPRRDVLGKCEDTRAGERQRASLTAGTERPSNWHEKIRVNVVG